MVIERPSLNLCYKPTVAASHRSSYEAKSVPFDGLANMTIFPVSYIQVLPWVPKVIYLCGGGEVNLCLHKFWTCTKWPQFITGSFTGINLFFLHSRFIKPHIDSVKVWTLHPLHCTCTYESTRYWSIYKYPSCVLGVGAQEIMAQEGEEQGTHILSLLPFPLKEKSVSMASVLNPGVHGTDVLLWITVRSTENYAFPLSVLQILFSSFVECCEKCPGGWGSCWDSQIQSLNPHLCWSFENC